MISKLRYLRPTGNKISLKSLPLNKDIFSPFNIKFYESGTAALATAILACCSKKDKKQAEVILPAYTCPDLISAIVHANAIPVLVDLEPDSPFMSLNEIRKNITSNTVAIIAINFLGIPERTMEIKKICNEHKLFLIEDSAQGLPVSNYENYWHGDIVIISFGRGKPLNLLGGGAILIHKNHTLHNSIKSIQPQETSSIKNIAFNLKIIIYNALINPYLYNLLTLMPSINLGQTIYKPLNSINPISKISLFKIQRNLEIYKSNKQDSNILSKALSSINKKDIVDLVTNQKETTMLLRHPFLIKNQQLKQGLLLNFSNYGLSEMYKKPLNKIESLEKILDSKKIFPNAENFSKHLITFPTHKDFKLSNISDIKNYLRGSSN